LKTSDQRPIYTALLEKHPHNYLLHSGEAYWNNRKGNRAGEVAHAELAVRASPNNALSWSELSGVLDRVAGDVRQGRYSRDISGREWAFLNGVYADSVACAKRAVALSPRDGGHWAQLARASTFGGDYNGAQRALWKSLALDPGNTDAYEWGFQMLQPKWGGSPAQVLKLAQLAASNAAKGWVPADDMVGALHTTQQQSQKEVLLVQIVQADPRNAQALAHYGSCLHYDRRQYKRAEGFYRAALAIDPNYARPLGSLADLHYFVKSDVAGAGKLYRQAIANEPGTASRYEDYARFLARTGNRNAALRIIKNAQRIGGNRSHPVWAELGVSP
jgi:tetratricopeptide (TPR) repeat protein